MYFGNGSQNDDYFIFNGIKLPNSYEGKILGVIIDNELKCRSNIKNMCEKAVQKLGVLNRLTSFLDPGIKNFVFKAVIKSHFSYCPFMWMFSSQKFINLINRIYKMSLRTVLNDTGSTFQKLLQLSKGIIVCHKNIKILTAEIPKIVYGIFPPFMKRLFSFRENKQNLRNSQEMKQTKKIRTVRYGLVNTPCISTLVGTARLTGEVSNFQKFFQGMTQE